MVWTLDRQVRAPDDFRGLKMRVMTSPLLLAAYEAYGASPTPSLTPRSTARCSCRWSTGRSTRSSPSRRDELLRGHRLG
ncbi:MAG: hypothetical protein R3F59_16935 [Myxococcota bacterium]